MKTTYVLTLGFDEKFALRALTRRGLGEGDEVLVVMSKPSDERAERAYRQLTEILGRIFQQKKTTRLDIDPRAFPSCLRTLIEALATKTAQRSVLVLSGGFRALILEVLLAASMLGLDAEVEVEFEDSSTLITFPLKWTTPLTLEKDEQKMLENLDGPTTLSELTKKVGLSKTTVWRKIRALEDRDLVKYSGREITLTELGKLALLVAQTKHKK